MANWVRLYDACMGQGVDPQHMKTRTRERAPAVANSEAATVSMNRIFSTAITTEASTTPLTKKRKIVETMALHH
jgi:hypothetical protein